MPSQIVDALRRDRVIFLPDQYLGRWVASQVTAQIILWNGACEVHERFTGAARCATIARRIPAIQIIAHPECPPDVLAEADFVGSTKGMIDWVGRHQPRRVVMVTECSMSDNVAGAIPDIEFMRPCNLCPHMKRITLPTTSVSRSRPCAEVIEIAPAIALRARNARQRMLEIGRRKAA